MKHGTQVYYNFSHVSVNYTAFHGELQLTSILSVVFEALLFSDHQHLQLEYH